jgi:hypothetical protein
MCGLTANIGCEFCANEKDMFKDKKNMMILDMPNFSGR